MILTMNGVDITDNLQQQGSVSLTDTVNARSVLRFTIQDPTATIRPLRGYPITFTNSDAVQEFGGTIDVVERIVPTPGSNARKWNITTVDFSQLADRIIAAETFANEYAGDIFSFLVTTYLADDAVTLGTIEAGPLISKFVVNYQTLAWAFNKLTDLTGFTWMIEPDKSALFASRESVAAPWSITDDDPNCVSIRVKEGRDQYRNLQYVRAGLDLTDVRVESFVGDGTRKTFTLQYPAGTAPTVTVNAVAKTVGIRGVETGFDFYWNKNSSEISQDDGATALTSGQTLAVTYRGLFPIIVQARNDSGIAERIAVEGGSGHYENATEEPQLDSSTAALEVATGLLSQYPLPTTVTVVTRRQGLRAGQLLAIQATPEGLDGLFLITQVSCRDITIDDREFTVTCSDGSSVGGWIQYYNRLAAARRNEQSRENEVLVRLRQFADAVACGDEFTASTSAPESRIGTARIGFAEVA